MTATIGEGFDDETERGQTEVNLLGFLESFAFSACLCDTLTTCEIY